VLEAVDKYSGFKKSYVLRAIRRFMVLTYGILGM
jgi:hypothetical protein